MRHLTRDIIVVLLLATGPAWADDFCDPPIPDVRCYEDAPGDTFLRRTCTPADWPVNPGRHPDLLGVRIGRWCVYDPDISLFDGEFHIDCVYFRLDLLLDGLMNPSGPCRYDALWGFWEFFDPLLYGPNPLLGHMEFIADLNLNTIGAIGETDRNQDYWLCNVGRFGFRAFPRSPSRTAVRFQEAFYPFFTHPQTQWNGNEMVLHLGGRVSTGGPTITDIEKLVGDDDDLFEAGETWILHGSFLCRAPADIGGTGMYCPGTQLMFSHSVEADETTVSLVFPLIQDPATFDNEPDNEFSVWEILWTMQQIGLSVPSADPIVDAVFEEWGGQDPLVYLDPQWWYWHLMLSTCYTLPPAEGQPFAWTDYAEWWGPVPDNRAGDLTGDGVVDADDAADFASAIVERDGDPIYDADGDSTNGSLTIPNYPMNFSLYDKDYSGVVDCHDRPLPGWADLDFDSDVDLADFQVFAGCLGGPGAFGTPGCHGADLECDGDVDLVDFALFQQQFSSSE